jgi:hypothetical protein
MRKLQVQPSRGPLFKIPMNFKPAALLVIALVCSMPFSASALVAFNPAATAETTVEQSGSEWLYNYKVTNLSTCWGNCLDTIMGKPILTYWMDVTTYSIPFFSDAGITNIASPAGWTYQILSDDTFNLGFGAGTLQWTTVGEVPGIALNAALSGFSYRSLYAPGKGPFEMALRVGERYPGDPGIPMSPDAIKAGIGQPAQVPEPQTWLLFLSALGVLGARAAYGRRSR